MDRVDDALLAYLDYVELREKCDSRESQELQELIKMLEDARGVDMLTARPSLEKLLGYRIGS